MKTAFISLDQVKIAEAIIIACPSWFARLDFQTWLRSTTGPATWSGRDSLWQQLLLKIRSKPVVLAYADAFIPFDNVGMCSLDDPENPLYGGFYRWEGADNLPDDIYQEIGAILNATDMSSGVIWLKPFDTEPDKDE